MQNLQTRLTVLHDDDGSFTDHSTSAQDYSRDAFSLVLTTSEDNLYIGYFKPINAVYIETGTANTNSTDLTLKYYNGTSFTAVSDFIDESKGITRSGFVRWDRNLTDETKTTVNSSEKYWYQLSYDATFSAGTTIQGLNIVFADDQDLKTRVPAITSSKFLPSGETTQILAHVAARDEIIQQLRNHGKFMQSVANAEFKDVDAFSLLEIEQIREAAKFKALQIIFEDLTDSPEDIYMERAKMYKSEFDRAMNLFFLSLDSDDDGFLDRGEELRSFTPRLRRV